MLRTLDALSGSTLAVQDGEVGRVTDFYFDDQEWTVRYLVVDTGGWLDRHRVLVSPIAIGGISGGVIHANLTREQVEQSPDIDLARPVSRQREAEYHSYFGWPPYWIGGPIWGGVAFPWMLAGSEPLVRAPERRAEEPPGDPHLRSADEVAGYHARALDGAIGHVDDFVIDDQTWTIRYLVVETRNWLPGRKVLVAPHWFKSVSWERREVLVDLSRDAIRSGPEWRADHAADEARLEALEREAHEAR